MQMMVVQPGQHRTAVGIEHLLGVQTGPSRSAISTDALVDPDVGDAPVRQLCRGESACGQPGFDQLAHAAVVRAELRLRRSVVAPEPAVAHRLSR